MVNRTTIRNPGQVTAYCHRAARTAGWQPVLHCTTRYDAGAGLARDALAAGAGLVIAVGGDGTVRACAQALAGTGVPLAIVPTGTANLTARALGIPARAGAALATGFGGHERRIDLAAADGIGYTAMAGIGVDAAVVGGTPGVLKARAGWLAYAAAGAWHALGPRAVFAVRLDAAAQPLIRRARSVVVGNAGLLPGGFGLLPDARLDDGVLDVAILGPASPLGWARVGYRIITGSRREDQQLERHRARRVEIVAATVLPREADGEMIPPGRSLTVTVSPGALLVRVPAPR